IRDRTVTGVQTCALPICSCYALPLGVDEQGLDGCCGSHLCFQLCNNSFVSNRGRNSGDLCWDSDLLCCLGDVFGYSIERGGLTEIGRASCRERVEVLVGR